MIEVGMIGFGKMAQAIAAGWQNAGLLDRIHVQAYAPHYDKLCRNCKTYDVTPMKTLHELCEASHVIILACKPAQVEGVLSECRDWVDGKLVICLAAGINHEKLDAWLPYAAHVSVMPNTAMMVQAGCLIVEEPNTMSERDTKVLEDLFEPLGSIVPVPAALFGIAGTISGCGPAFLGLFAEALADAGVKYGLPRATAASLAARTVYGAGAMLSLNEMEPAVFKNEICSPGGTTIRGIVTLEKDGFRKAVIEAIEAIEEKK
ncbi:pyrroline-5-carboxylate reductase [uncultured Allobaculum sp.]|uniref:pyrroline-5-carboxylate reductase n=1 Tax=uncultured Allobaculum sp. TaxID=1187017 RepID=UPI00259B9EC4|nr:pyrroline-5-carboxylate reductase [uncultured Allobaculum sp.]